MLFHLFVVSLRSLFAFDAIRNLIWKASSANVLFAAAFIIGSESVALNAINVSLRFGVNPCLQNGVFISIFSVYPLS